MKLLAVCVGRRETLQIGQKKQETGICKTPVEGPVRVHELGVAGDVIVSTEHHGGADQAVYAYSAQDYDWWAEQLQGALEPGTFGENLVLSSFGEDEVRVGDRFRVGGALLEVTAPRIPCATFAARMNDAAWVKKFHRAGRPGIYLRVLEAGEVRAGDAVSRERVIEDAPSVAEMFGVWTEKTPEPELLHRLLAAPVAERYRRSLERMLPAGTI